jgi:hypothetical protein
MPNNYVLLDRIELNANATSVTFDNIPQSGYTDLKVVASVRDDFASVSVNLGMRINGSSTGLSGRVVFGTGSSASSTTVTDAIGYTVGTSGTANTYSSTEIYIPNYRLTDRNKSYLADSAAESNTTTVYMQMLAGLWSNTGAINSITLYPQNATNMVAGSTFSLYGIAQVGTTPVVAPKADGGNVIGTDGTYWYHTFLTNGTFTPQVGLTCDYLVVAGGGAGGANGNYGGGGGAGGLRSTVTATGGGGSLESALNLISGINYTVTIGAGGAGGTEAGGSGVNSVFSTITSLGGGGGGGGVSNGVAGGSGGAAGYHNAARTGGAGTANQGYAGGNNWSSSSPFPSGGGGGAGAVGANASSGANGSGGNGVTTSISGSSVTYAGGGGGGSPSGATAGAGGTGGGGAGGVNTIGSTGAVNTGGGGGNFVAGGSGIVIIRYLVA